MISISKESDEQAVCLKRNDIGAMEILIDVGGLGTGSIDFHLGDDKHNYCGKRVRFDF